MEGILFILIFSLLIWLGWENMKIKKQIKDLKKDFSEREKSILEVVDNLKTNFDTRSKSILEESKSHLDAALIAISRRIGKRENPKEGTD